MRISNVTIKSFKRFHDLTIQNIPEATRLVVMAGPNGCGKSSLFDAFLLWHRLNSRGSSRDPDYYNKVGLPLIDVNGLVEVSFHQATPQENNHRKNFSIFAQHIETKLISKLQVFKGLEQLLMKIACRD